MPNNSEKVMPINSESDTAARMSAVALRNGIVVPRVISGAGDAAARRFLEFFRSNDPEPAFERPLIVR